MLIISGYCEKPEIRGIFIIFAAKAVLNRRGIKFVIIAISIAIAIAI